MKTFNIVYLLSDPKNRSCFFITALICGVFFFGSAFIANNCREIVPIWNVNDTSEKSQSDDCQMSPGQKINDSRQDAQYSKFKDQCRPSGSEALPEGIITRTSNLKMHSLREPVAATKKSKTPLIKKKKKSKSAVNLLAIAVGIQQKQIVNQIIEKFIANDFVVMLFHYDGVVDDWSDFGWSSHVIHVSAKNQTKWWFAKRFLHPDIVAEYDYVFLWDEDLGVKNFHPGRYLSIVKNEGLEISQPALDPTKSEVHHQITARRRHSRVHRRFYKSRGGGRCDDNSTAPPCIGWVEMMAPVFSRAAWQCAWYMIQNDLIYLWGLDMKLGYCAQGDRTKKVGVVDSEYIVHLALPTLGYSDRNKLSDETPAHFSQTKHLSDSDVSESSVLHRDDDDRIAVRRKSYIEMKIFENRWNDAVKEDKSWVDPYQRPALQKK